MRVSHRASGSVTSDRSSLLPVAGPAVLHPSRCGMAGPQGRRHHSRRRFGTRHRCGVPGNRPQKSRARSLSHVRSICGMVGRQLSGGLRYAESCSGRVGGAWSGGPTSGSPRRRRIRIRHRRRIRSPNRRRTHSPNRRRIHSRYRPRTRSHSPKRRSTQYRRRTNSRYSSRRSNRCLIHNCIPYPTRTSIPYR